MNHTMYSFMPEGETCAIFEPHPPRHWYNYLWNEHGYCAQVSQLGHGRSFYINDKADMCRINGSEARYVYLRDDAIGACWNIGVGPLETPVERYRCEHGIGFTRISSACQGIAASWRICVPRGGFHELWELVLCNESDRARELSIFSAVSFELEGFEYPRYYEMYRCIETRFDASLNGIYCASGHPFAPHRRYNAFLASPQPVYAYDGELSAFCGSGSTLTRPDGSVQALFQRPRVVVDGLDCTASGGALFIPGGVLQHKVTLEPGEERNIVIILGVCENPEEARAVVRGYTAPGAAEVAAAEAIAYNEARYSSLSAHTPDDRIDHIMNRWVQKQLDCCIMGKKGVRDNLQIAVALLDSRQERARAEILGCLAHQFRDGHAVLTWYPYDDTRYSDQPFWMIWAVCELIKETGDFSLLERDVPWQDGGADSVLTHLRAAARLLTEDVGPHGLCRLRFADWNDALNVTTDPDAESVMLSEQACLALHELAELLRRTGRTDEAEKLEHERAVLKRRINEKAWDGGWYVRALTKDGPVGSKDSGGSKLYLNAQTWAVLADVALRERLGSLLRAIDGMEHDFGFPLNQPPYEHYSPQVGRMSGMLPGLFENGGIYCHATGFKLMMDCKLGRGSEAVRTLKKIMPDSVQNPSSRSGAEPYVFTNCYSTHPGYYGRSYASWTTGTSAWAVMGLYEGVLGVRRDYDGLRVRPCLPPEWERAEVERRFRGAVYHILLLNPEHREHGIVSLVADGRPLDGELLPDYRDGARHEITALMR